MDKQDVLNAFRETIGKEKFLSNMHNCPDCGRGEIGDKPCLVKNLWVFDKFEKFLLNALTEFEREIRKETIEEVRVALSNLLGPITYSEIIDPLYVELEKEKRT